MVQETTTDNAQLVRSGYEAFASGDLAAVQQLFHPGAIWHTQRLGELSGDHVGWPAIAEFFGRTMELTQGSFRIEVLEVLTNATSGAAVVQSSAQRQNKSLNDRQIHLFHLEGNKVVEVWQFVGEAANEFWS